MSLCEKPNKTILSLFLDYFLFSSLWIKLAQSFFRILALQGC